MTAIYCSYQNRTRAGRGRTTAKDHARAAFRNAINPALNQAPIAQEDRDMHQAVVERLSATLTKEQMRDVAHLLRVRAELVEDYNV